MIMKILRMTTDKQRVTFFAWSHLLGWLLANIQTVVIMWQAWYMYKKTMEKLEELKNVK
jgi:hypothetical protein